MDDTAQQPVVPEPPQMVSPPQQPSSPPPLVYEETPEIPVVIEPPKKSGSLGKKIGILIAFIVLFVLGINVSSTLRNFFPAQTGNEDSQAAIITPLITPSIVSSTAEWKTYSVISGVTKTAIPGVAYQLPPEILPPICDGVSCTSQGTYLPGGTRFTIAARGIGQSLRDFRGSVISDANGVPIPTKQLVLEKFTATEYESSGSGRTISGYAFSRIRGVMIPLSDTLSLEVNHFLPNGITGDFQNDDMVFNEIIKTVVMVSITPTVFPVATSSGY
jgi:hypothetical protein